MTFARYKDLLDVYISSGRSKEKLLAYISSSSDLFLDVDILVMTVKIIAAVSDGDISALIGLSGLNVSKFSVQYVLPYRTLQDWLAKGKCRQSDIVHVGYIMISDL